MKVYPLKNNPITVLRAKFFSQCELINDSNERAKTILNRLTLFPNQFAYIVDYATSEVFARNTQKFLRIPSSMVRFEHILDTIQTLETDQILSYTLNGVTYAYHNKMQPMNGVMCLNYHLYNKKHLNRSTYILELDKNGFMTKSLSICTDITHLKLNENPKPFIQYYGEYVNITTNPLENPSLSPRELQVICLINEGFTSIEIARKLNISKHTVDGYRRGLLEKTKCDNTVQLLQYAKDLYWIK